MRKSIGIKSLLSTWSRVSRVRKAFKTISQQWPPQELAQAPNTSKNNSMTSSKKEERKNNRNVPNNNASKNNKH